MERFRGCASAIGYDHTPSKASWSPMLQAYANPSQQLTPRWRIIFIAAASLYLTSGCATRHGRVERAPAMVTITSDPPGLSYFVISPQENDELGGDYADLTASGDLAEHLNRKHIALRAYGEEHGRTPGEKVLLIDCGARYERLSVSFEGSQELTLRCR